MKNEQIEAIRARANSVIDGFTKHRERSAKDTLELCDEVLRLNRLLLAAKLTAAAASTKKTAAEDFMKDIFK